MKTSILVAFLAVFCAAQAAKPHIVVLVLDDVGWADVGYHGSNFPTPNIDSLAAGGVKLERMYAMPQCSPTRSALLTGRYAFRLGMQHFTTITPGSNAALPSDTPTVAEVMRDAGYATHMIGKWHLGYHSWDVTPTGRGFQSYLGYLQGQTDYYNRTLPSSRVYQNNADVDTPYGTNGDAYDFWRDRTPATDEFGQYTADAYEARAKEILAAYADGTAEAPLFLYYAEQQLHLPLEMPPEPEYAEACRGVTGGTTAVNRTVLCAMAARLDASVGRLTAMLREYGMWDNTLLWVYSDNGGMTQYTDQFPASASSNFPLRGGKTTLFEGGVRSVSFVSGGLVPSHAAGTTVSDLLHAVDILPTVAALGGARLDPSLPLDGLAAWDAIVGTTPLGRTELPLQIDVNPLQVGGGALPHPPHPTDGMANYSAIIVWPYKLLLGVTYVQIGPATGNLPRDGWWTVDPYTFIPPPNEGEGYARLYNLETDESEKHDLAAAHPEIVASMTQRITEVWANKTAGFVPSQINIPGPLANPKYHKRLWSPFN